MVESRYDVHEFSSMTVANLCRVAMGGLRHPSVADRGLLNEHPNPDL